MLERRQVDRANPSKCNNRGQRQRGCEEEDRLAGHEITTQPHGSGGNTVAERGKPCIPPKPLAQAGMTYEA
jgi:hypothetical protein